jgi:hypothetical protein
MSDCNKCKCQYSYTIKCQDSVFGNRNGLEVFACTAAETDTDASEFWDSEIKPDWDCPCYRV